MDRYRKDLSRRDIIKRTLEADSSLTPRKRTKLEQELAVLEDDISNNAVSELVEEGIFQSIIEDLEFEEDIFSGRAKLARANRVKRKATKAGKQHARHGLHKGKKR